MGAHAIVYSDHNNVSKFLGEKTPHSSRVMRWKSMVSNINFTIKFISGKDNICADYLTRTQPRNDEYDHTYVIKKKYVYNPSKFIKKNKFDSNNGGGALPPSEDKIINNNINNSNNNNNNSSFGKNEMINNNNNNLNLKKKNFIKKSNNFNFNNNSKLNNSNDIPSVIDDENNNDNIFNKKYLNNISDIDNINIKNIGYLQRKDKLLLQIIKGLKYGLHHIKIPYWRTKAQQQHFKINDEILYYVSRSGNMKICIPKQFNIQYIQRFHDLCHAGIAKTKTLIQHKFWMENITDLVQKYVGSCKICSKNKYGIKRKRRLKLFNVNMPLKMLSVDLIGPLPSSIPNSMKYIMVCVDKYTRHTILIPLRSKYSNEVIRGLSIYFGKVGIPQKVLTDNGREFVNNKVHNYLKRKGIRQIRTSPYSPQSNSINENCHRVVNYLMTMYLDANNENIQSSYWENYVHQINRIMNLSINTTTGYAPYEMLHGTELFARQYIRGFDMKEEDEKYVENLNKNLELIAKKQQRIKI